MKFLRGLALATVPVIGAFVCVLLLHVDTMVLQVRSDAHATAGATIADEAALTQAAIATMATADGSLTSISRATTRTLYSANDVLKTVNRPCGDDKACGTLADVAKTLNTARGTLGQVEIAANSFDKHQSTFYTQEANLSTATQKTLTDVDAIVSSEKLNDALQNFDESTKQAAAIMTDARFEADKLAHPPKNKLTFWGIITAGGDTLRHFMPPIF